MTYKILFIIFFVFTNSLLNGCSNLHTQNALRRSIVSQPEIDQDNWFNRQRLKCNENKKLFKIKEIQNKYIEYKSNPQYFYLLSFCYLQKNNLNKSIFFIKKSIALDKTQDRLNLLIHQNMLAIILFKSLKSDLSYLYLLNSIKKSKIHIPAYIFINLVKLAIIFNKKLNFNKLKTYTKDINNAELSIFKTIYHAKRRENKQVLFYLGQIQKIAKDNSFLTKFSSDIIKINR